MLLPDNFIRFFCVFLCCFFSTILLSKETCSVCFCFATRVSSAQPLRTKNVPVSEEAQEGEEKGGGGRKEIEKMRNSSEDGSQRTNMTKKRSFFQIRAPLTSSSPFFFSDDIHFLGSHTKNSNHNAAVFPTAKHGSENRSKLQNDQNVKLSSKAQKKQHFESPSMIVRHINNVNQMNEKLAKLYTNINEGEGHEIARDIMAHYDKIQDDRNRGWWWTHEVEEEDNSDNEETKNNVGGYGLMQLSLQKKDKDDSDDDDDKKDKNDKKDDDDDDDDKDDDSKKKKKHHKTKKIHIKKKIEKQDLEGVIRDTLENVDKNLDQARDYLKVACQLILDFVEKLWERVKEIHGNKNFSDASGLAAVRNYLAAKYGNGHEIHDSCVTILKFVEGMDTAAEQLKGSVKELGSDVDIKNVTLISPTAAINATVAVTPPAA